MPNLITGWALPGVPSPCIGVCRLDAAGGSCLGCRRSVDEIAEWPGASDARRRQILQRLAQLPDAPAAADGDGDRGPGRPAGGGIA